MQIAFGIIAVILVLGALAAMSLRNLVHCALSLALCFAAIAALYLQLGAEFVGWAQVLVYIGAVAILVMFAILLTRGGGATAQRMLSPSWIVGAVVGGIVLATLIAAIMSSAIIGQPAPPAPELAVRQIGDQLMTQHVLGLEVIALLLTAALIGAAVIAMREKGNS
jgi:NADH:ubiquinone oxidoreductase subunit 6 (subunit J)